MAIRPRGTPISASRSRIRWVMFDCTPFSACAALAMPPALATAANAAKSPAPMPALIFPTVGKPDGFAHKKPFFMQGFKAYFSQPGARGRRPPTRPSPQRCAPDRPCARTTKDQASRPLKSMRQLRGKAQGTDGLDGLYATKRNTTPSAIAFSGNVPPSTDCLRANRELTHPATECAGRRHIRAGGREGDQKVDAWVDRAVASWLSHNGNEGACRLPGAFGEIEACPLTTQI